MKPHSRFLISCLPMLAACYVLAEKPDAPAAAPAAQTAVAQASREIIAAAQDFLASLDATQAPLAQFDFGSEERQNWHFVPIERKGLSIKAMRPDQRHLAQALLSSTLSNEGLRKVNQIMSLEKILSDLEKDTVKRDPEKYFVSIFGTPAASGAWGFRYEGHHLSMNVTLVDGKVVSVTPTFLGANPGLVAEGARKGLEVLQDEDLKGIALFRALTPDQQKAATIATEVPKDIFSAEKPVAEKLEAKGILASALQPGQQEALFSLLEEYVRRYRPELADADMLAIRQSKMDQIQFAWVGEADPGKPHYYRVQGPGFLFEYDNVQNNARHPHAVWREFHGDFGRDMLAEHHKGEH